MMPVWWKVYRCYRIITPAEMREVHYTTFRIFRRQVIRWNVSGLLKFDFCALLGDITRDLTYPYITITGK